MLVPKLVLGETSPKRPSFVATGSAQAGIFSLSLAVTPNFVRAGTYVTLPESPQFWACVDLDDERLPAQRRRCTARATQARHRIGWTSKA